MLIHRIYNLRFPVLAAIQTSDENCRGFIRRPRLHFVIRTVFLMALLACEHIRRRADFLVVFRRVALLFDRNQLVPSVRVELLVIHKGKCGRRYFPAD